MRSPRLFPLLLLFVFAFASTARVHADGKVFRPHLVPQEISMPGQRALLAWHDNTETLVIETHFRGEGTDFAWIVPLPSKPEVTAATSGTLPSASAALLPEIVRPWDIPVELLAFLSLAGLLILLFGHIRGFVFILFIGSLLLAFVVPTVGKVRSSASAGPGAFADLEIERQLIGDYEVTLLSGRDHDTVSAWFAGHGFYLTPAAEPVIADHVRAGGWFVATRLRRDRPDAAILSAPTPLVFTFETATPLYPMRLTGAGATEPLDLELLIFGPGEARADHLKTITTAPVVFADDSSFDTARREIPLGHILINHPELRRLGADTAAATHLRGTLSPARMQSDITLSWHPPRSADRLFYSRDDVARRGVLLAASTLLILALVVSLRHAGKRVSSATFFKTTLGCALFGTVVAFSFPSIPTEAVRHPAVASSDHRQATQVMMIAIDDLPADERTPERIRAAVAADFAKYENPDWPLRLGDAPGNYTLHHLPDGAWRLTRINHRGHEIAFPEWDYRP